MEEKSLYFFFFIYSRNVASAYCSHAQYVGVQLDGAYYLTLFARTRIVSLMHARNICHVTPRVTTGVNRTQSDFPPFLKLYNRVEQNERKFTKKIKKKYRIILIPQIKEKICISTLKFHKNLLQILLYFIS